MPTRDDLLSQPRSGARPLGGSAPASPARATSPPQRTAPVPAAPAGTGSGAASGRVAASPGRTPPSGAAGPYAGSPRLPEPKAYGNVLVMEFIGVLLLTVLTPWSKQNHRKGLSPYGGAEMVKLAAIVLLFFLLSAVASASSGAARLAAWLGGLVLIADGLYEASNIAKDFQLFTGGLASAAGASTTAAPAAAPDGTLPIATMPVGGSGDPAGGQPPPSSLFPVVTPLPAGPGGAGGQYPVS